MRISPKDVSLGAIFLVGALALAASSTFMIMGASSVFVSTPQPVFRPSASVECPAPAGVIDNPPKKHRVVWL